MKDIMIWKQQIALNQTLCKNIYDYQNFMHFVIQNDKWQEGEK